MILTCPECATSYFVDDGRIPAAGRTVKCQSCSARWLATPEAAAEPEPPATDPAPEVSAEPAAPPADDLGGEALPKLFRARAETERRVREAAATGIVWAGMAAGLAVLIALSVVFRVDVVRLWPRSAQAFASVGLPVNSLGLTIEGVRFEPALQDGHAALAVSGVIRNIEDRPITAPPLRISLLNKAGKTVAAKIARPADPTIPPGETRHFALALLDPPTTAHDLEIAFAPEAAHIPARVRAPVPPHLAETPLLRAEPGPAPTEATPLPAGSPDALEPHG